MTHNEFMCLSKGDIVRNLKTGREYVIDEYDFYSKCYTMFRKNYPSSTFVLSVQERKDYVFIDNGGY